MCPSSTGAHMTNPHMPYWDPRTSVCSSPDLHSGTRITNEHIPYTVSYVTQAFPLHVPVAILGLPYLD
jgi:hypothetical protein